MLSEKAQLNTENDRVQAYSSHGIRVQNLEPPDFNEIQLLDKATYPLEEPYTKTALKEQHETFPEGQFVAKLQDKIVGYCASFRTTYTVATNPHTWTNITEYGTIRNHNPLGKWLYGMELNVAEDYRRLGIGAALYSMRKKLCHELNLKGIICGGRMSGYAAAKHSFHSPAEYLKAVINKKASDPTLNFQLSQGFKPKAIFLKYHKPDIRSDGNAVLMIWHKV